MLSLVLFVFFFNDTATTEIYTLSLHDALPICGRSRQAIIYNLRVFFEQSTINSWLDLPRNFLLIHPEDLPPRQKTAPRFIPEEVLEQLNEHIGELPDRKSTRLNSSHWPISYAVFCLKKKKKQKEQIKEKQQTPANHKSIWHRRGKILNQHEIISGITST